MTDGTPEFEVDHAMAEATTGSTVLRGGIWTTAKKILPQATTLVVSIAAARFLGPDGLGRQSLIAFAAATAIYVLGLGLPLSLMRQIGESVGTGEANKARGLVRWVWRFAFAGATIGLIGSIALALGGAEPQAAWILAGFIVAAGVLAQMPDAVLSGLQHWRDTSRIVIWGSVLGAVATIVVLAGGGGITGMIAVQLVVALGILAAMAPIARRRLLAVAPQSEDPGALRRRTLKYAGSVFLGSIVTVVVFRRSELFFLDYYSTDSEIAVYSVAFSLTTTLVLVPESLGTVLIPAIATMFGAGQMDRVRSGYSRALRLLTLGTLPVAASGLALGPELLETLFGPSFHASGTPLMILLTVLPLVPLMNASTSVIVGLGKVTFPILAGLGSAVINVSLDFLLIPPYEAIGAATANAIAQAFSAFAILIYGVHLVGPVRWTGAVLMRMAFAATASGLAARASLVALGGGVPGLVVGAAAGLAAFAIVGSVLGVIPREDGRWLRSSFDSALIGTVVRRLEAR